MRTITSEYKRSDIIEEEKSKDMKREIEKRKKETFISEAYEEPKFSLRDGDWIYDRESSQEIAEQAHDETKRHMLEEYGQHMSEEQKKLLESEETNRKFNVVSSEEYHKAFPNTDSNVLGHCDSEGNINMKSESSEVVNHVSTHETMHLCANRETYYFTEDQSEVIISGVHETFINENMGDQDYNRGINEGLTEMYTMRELNARGDVLAAYSMDAYSEARMWAERLSVVIDEETLDAAYFGEGREALKEEFNQLNNDENAWDDFSRDIDILEYSADEMEIDNARKRLAEQYKKMVYNKYEIEVEI